MECACIFGGIEVTIFVSPVSPASSQPTKDLSTVVFSTEYRVALLVEQGVTLVVELRHTRFSEVLLSQNIRGHLGPIFGNRDVVLMKDHRTVRIPDL